MAFEDLTNSIRELKYNIDALKHSSAKYYKLKLYKSVVKGAVSLITIAMVSFMGLIALIFLSIAVAISISNALGIPSAGFFIVAGFYLLLVFLIFTVGKRMLRKTILKKTSRKIFNE